ncbi:transposase, partial [Paraburkholderia mimosarum]|uniref:transposase n=2 Tax=Paraburkholderia mimosarum TaxID=312026 RepID=UPI0039C1F490
SSDTSRTKASMHFTRNTATVCPSLVEAQISRIKRCIGARLLTQELASQEGEGVIIANLLNRWNAFGKPICVKNA